MNKNNRLDSEKNKELPYTVVKNRKQKHATNIIFQNKDLNFISKNQYEVLSVEEEEEENGPKEQPVQTSSREKKKLLICADSHGRDLAWNLNQTQHTYEAVGLVRPGGRTGQVLDNHNIEEEKLGEEDGLVILCGTNDVAINNAQDAIKNIELVLNKITSTVSKIVVVDIPRRYDLVEWSCVNQEVKKTNCALKEMCNKFRDVSLVEVSRAERHLHTRHGMHLNRRGKMWLAHQIARVLDSKQEQETYNVSPTLRTGSEESVADAMMTTEISTPTTEDSTTSSGNSPLQTPTHNR
ncbi:hypothetical protein J6590_065204 [Homalodisca vitripennis]|nr:hypothetical protein J6590_065204 [Homalodisca vitripennis]